MRTNIARIKRGVALRLLPSNLYYLLEFAALDTIADTINQVLPYYKATVKDNKIELVWQDKNIKRN